MDFNVFLENLANQFDETNPGEITAETNYRELDEYSSLIALCIISMVDEEYNVPLKGEDIRSAPTVEQLYNLVKSRM